MRLNVTCDGCRRDVSGSKTAVIHISHGEVNSVMEQWQEWERKRAEDHAAGRNFIMAGDLAQQPGKVSWDVHCDECNPHENGCFGCYWFSLDRCQTTADMLGWTIHLMEKDWFQYTSWPAFVRSIAGPLDC